MSAPPIIPLLPSSQERPRIFNKPTNRSKTITRIFKLTFSLQTTLLIGAFFQSLLVLILPVRYAIAPTIIILGIRLIDTLLVNFGVKPNPYLKNASKKVAAMLPDRDGELNGPGKEKVAVLLLGSKINHPMGVFAPRVLEFNKFVMAMYSDLESADHQDNGFLGMSPWTHDSENGGIDLCTIMYFRSVQDVHNFAHSPVHKEAWKWWDEHVKELGHIGIMHEVFEAPAGSWEGVYINFQPVLMGATTFLKRGDKLIGGTVDDSWISPIVDASRGRMRTSNGRRGQTGKLSDEDIFGKNVYA
ncbi:hypothetical protein F5884DRAFT_752369 [Xylogone sp. PMI_703]|nr:hypothetical protein F5884DRAFT_752369 [Xylogone sp. PMI_703]